ncbi:orotate phosphoribosyltransferase [Candidatus Peregrinibacteria bacterium]|nr:orotate phosphoribosyltransferase [Candidatus Peregrinibacteria bacterium]
MTAEKIAEILLSCNAVKLNVKNPFTYTSGLKGPIYTDNRVLISYPQEREIIVDGFLNMLKERGLKPDYLAGTATAGIPWAAFLAHESSLPMVYVRSKPKEHGAGRQIEGMLKKSQNVLVIEDLVTTGGSAINTVKVLRAEGECMVHDVFAIFSYGLAKSEEAFRAESVALTTLTDIEVLLGVALNRGDLTEEEAEKVRKFRTDPENWWK